MLIVDMLGLTRSGSPAQREMLAELLVSDQNDTDVVYLTSDEDRIEYAARLRHGYGVIVFTGPRGADWWLTVSSEVGVYIQPDGVELKERVGDAREWAMRVHGVGKAYWHKEPTRGANVEPWQQAVALQAAVAEAETEHEPIGHSPVVVTIIRDPAEQVAFLDGLVGSPEHPVCLDWETTDKHFPCDIVGLAVSTREGDTYLPVRGADYTPSSDQERALREATARLIHRVPTVWHNAKYDLRVTAGNDGTGDPLDFHGAPIEDTMVLAYVLGESALGLKALTRKYLDRSAREYPGTLETRPVAETARYAAAGDSRNTLHLLHALRPKLAERKQEHVYTDIELPVVPFTASMEHVGFPVDPIALQQLQTAYDLTLRALEDIVAARDPGYSIATDDEQRRYVTYKLGYDPGTLSNAILTLKSEEPWMDTLIGYRKVRHRKRAFIDKHLARWEEAGKPDILWAHSNFNQAGAADAMDTRSFRRAPRTGRYSSSGDFGNLQNQFYDIRAAFVPPEGCVWWAADYSGLEVRIAAGITQDPAMLQVLTEECPDPNPEGKCPHTPAHGDFHGQFQYKAYELTGVLVDRRTAKGYNFGKQYGAGPDTVRNTLAKDRAFITIETAKTLDLAHKETYKVMHEHGLYRQREAARLGYSETAEGRRRYDPDLSASNQEDKRAALLAAGNMAVQGGAADIMKLAMAKLVPVLKKYGAHCAFQIHDELAGHVPIENGEAFLAELVEVMESFSVGGLPLKVEAGLGSNWAEVH